MGKDFGTEMGKDFATRDIVHFIRKIIHVSGILAQISGEFAHFDENLYKFFCGEDFIHKFGL